MFNLVHQFKGKLVSPHRHHILADGLGQIHDFVLAFAIVRRILNLEHLVSFAIATQTESPKLGHRMHESLTKLNASQLYLDVLPRGDHILCNFLKIKESRLRKNLIVVSTPLHQIWLN